MHIHRCDPVPVLGIGQVYGVPFRHFEPCQNLFRENQPRESFQFSEFSVFALPPPPCPYNISVDTQVITSWGGGCQSVSVQLQLQKGFENVSIKMTPLPCQQQEVPENGFRLYLWQDAITLLKRVILFFVNISYIMVVKKLKFDLENTPCPGREHNAVDDLFGLPSCCSVVQLQSVRPSNQKLLSCKKM